MLFERACVQLCATQGHDSAQDAGEGEAEFRDPPEDSSLQHCIVCVRVDELALEGEDEQAATPAAQQDPESTGLLAPPRCPTVYYMTMADFDGSLAASTAAKRLSGEVQLALDTAPGKWSVVLDHGQQCRRKRNHMKP